MAGDVVGDLVYFARFIVNLRSGSMGFTVTVIMLFTLVDRVGYALMIFSLCRISRGSGRYGLIYLVVFGRRLVVDVYVDVVLRIVVCPYSLM